MTETLTAILDITAAPALFYSWLWLEHTLQKSLQQGLVVSD